MIKIIFSILLATILMVGVRFIDLNFGNSTNIITHTISLLSTIGLTGLCLYLMTRI
jgi:hypothetical protein